MTDNVEVFEIDDDFDPLADAGLEIEEDDEPTYESSLYQMPIPDADKSIVPPKVELPAAERIEKLIKGMGGQKYRLLTAIQICATEKTLEEAAAELDEAYPLDVSVYSSSRVIELLVEAGAIDRFDYDNDEEDLDEEPLDEPGTPFAKAADMSAEDLEAYEDERVDSISLDEIDAGYEEINPVEPSTYLSTEDGLAAVEARWSVQLAFDLIKAEPQYLPLWKTVLDRCAVEGGITKKALCDEIDSHELLKKPRRWGQYFLGKYNDTGALRFDDKTMAWQITDLGREVLASDIFDALNAVDDAITEAVVEAANEVLNEE